METTNQTVSPLRRRMIEDMRMRKLMPKTREALYPGRSQICQVSGQVP
jgi:hypothetical protein